MSTYSLQIGLGASFVDVLEGDVGRRGGLHVWQRRRDGEESRGVRWRVDERPEGVEEQEERLGLNMEAGVSFARSLKRRARRRGLTSFVTLTDRLLSKICSISLGSCSKEGESKREQQSVGPPMRQGKIHRRLLCGEIPLLLRLRKVLLVSMQSHLVNDLQKLRLVVVLTRPLGLLTVVLSKPQNNVAVSRRGPNIRATNRKRTHALLPICQRSNEDDDERDVTVLHRVERAKVDRLCMGDQLVKRAVDPERGEVRGVRVDDCGTKTSNISTKVPVEVKR